MKAKLYSASAFHLALFLACGNGERGPQTSSVAGTPSSNAGTPSSNGGSASPSGGSPSASGGAPSISGGAPSISGGAPSSSGGSKSDAGSGPALAGSSSGGAAVSSGGSASSTGGAAAGNAAQGGLANGGGGASAATAVGAPTVRIAPGGWKCTDTAARMPTLDGATPARVAGVPPADGFSLENAFPFPGGLEGPVWIGDALYVSELSTYTYDETNTRVAKARILKVGSNDSVSVAVADSGSNGLAVDGSGAIIAAVHKDGTLTRFSLPDGAASYIATGYTNSRFDAPNDLVIRSDGNVYFSDPEWQAPAVLPQSTTRVYRINPQGEVTALNDTFVNPNGVTLSVDEAWLYVAARTGRRYAIATDGSVGAGEDFPATSGVDGITLDCAGNLYVARGRDVVVYDPAGNMVGTIRVPDLQSVTNMAFGGSERKTLYITGLGPRRGLFKVQLDIPGRPY